MKMNKIYLLIEEAHDWTGGYTHSKFGSIDLKYITKVMNGFINTIEYLGSNSPLILFYKEFGTEHEMKINADEWYTKESEIQKLEYEYWENLKINTFSGLPTYRIQEIDLIN